MLLYLIFKITFINITTNLMRKVFQVLRCYQALADGHKFSKNLIFVWKFDFYRWQQIMSTGFLKQPDKLSMCIFKEMSTRYTSWNNHSLSAILSSKNEILWKRGGKQLFQLPTQSKTAHDFSWGTIVHCV